MIKLLRFFKSIDWLFFAIIVCLIAGQVYLDLKLPDFVNIMTNDYVGGVLTSAKVWQCGGLMLACAVGSGLLAVATGFFVAKITAGFSARLRQKVFSSCQDYSFTEIKKFSTPSLITRTTNDVSQVQGTFAMGMQVLIKAPIMAIWAIAKITSKSYELSLLTAGAVVVLLSTIITVMCFAIPRFKKVQKFTDNINRVTRENLTGVRVVRAFNAENFEAKKFEKANKDITENYTAVGKLMSILTPAMSFVMSTLSLGIYWLGSVLIDNTDLSFMLKKAAFSDTVVFMNYSVQVVISFIMLAMTFIMLPRALVSAKRINEVIDLSPSIKNGDFVGKTEATGEVEFKNVSFKYPDADEYVLKDVNFSVKKGETVAFIGSTGSGKSTLINLIPRFYDVTDGEILIDGINVKDYNISTLHEKIGYVSQKAVIFSGTIKDNLMLGSTIEKTESDLNASLKTAQASEFIEKLPEGINYHLAQGGTNVSGGQKQRLSIARALNWGGEILIFDDSFSALDFQTDKNLRKALSKKQTTKFIVAQRIGTILNADKIVVLEAGEVVGIGKHDELLKTCEVYKEIALSQLKEEEL